jgi:NAD(P)-dependent dehydrogenase (short-subunit alcohol dehydrogenase family)
VSSSIAGARVLVTGGTRGLGRAVALELAARGASVAVTWTRDESAAAETLSALRAAAPGAAGASAWAYRVSVTDVPGTLAMVKELERDAGGVTHLVNNAGISQTLPLALIDEADWDQVMDVNVKGAFFTSKAVLRGMIRRRAGVILNVGSVLGLRMIEGPIHYCASKAALRGMTEAMAKEVARYGVRVSCLAPGLLDEGMGLRIPEPRRQDFVKHCALGRPGRLDEVARFAAFLLSDEASYVSGETIAMDGGL